MTLLDAVSIRSSQRKYLPEPISQEQRLQLQKTIDQCCRRSGLKIQLICDHPAPFASFIRTYGMLRGVRNYLVLAGKKSDPHLEEKCGYYGEEIVLTATTMSLGTCWVGGTFQKNVCADSILKDASPILNVFIRADLPFRVSRIMEAENCTEKAAVDMISKADKKRAKYYNFYTQKRWGAADSYDLVLNNAKLGAEKAVQIIAEYARAIATD